MTTQSIGMKALTSTALFAALVLPARADLLIDPISLLSSEYHYFGFAGLNPSYETDLDVSNQNATVESTVDRAASLNIGLFYNFSKTFGYYWSLTADSDSTYVSGATEIDVEGFTNSLGFYSMFGLSSDYPTAGWAEATMVRLEATDSDATFESTEVAGGLLARVYNTEQLALSVGAEFIVLSDGEIKNPGSNGFDTERADSFGGKAMATYQISDKLSASAQASFGNKSAVAISAILGIQ